uniref:Uncharacterized protein n=1 Tax=Arundo donax TaxID=35708 RepID=A0A0A9CZ02_ARUDO
MSLSTFYFTHSFTSLTSQFISLLCISSMILIFYPHFRLPKLLIFFNLPLNFGTKHKAIDPRFN